MTKVLRHGLRKVLFSSLNKLDNRLDKKIVCQAHESWICRAVWFSKDSDISNTILNMMHSLTT